MEESILKKLSTEDILELQELSSVEDRGHEFVSAIYREVVDLAAKTEEYGVFIRNGGSGDDVRSSVGRKRVLLALSKLMKAVKEAPSESPIIICD